MDFEKILFEKQGSVGCPEAERPLLPERILKR